MFKAKCPLCNGTYQAKPEWIGKQAPCPHCHQRITIQADETEPVPLAMPILSEKDDNSKLSELVVSMLTNNPTTDDYCKPTALSAPVSINNPTGDIHSKTNTIQTQPTIQSRDYSSGMRVARMGTRLVAFLLDTIFLSVLVYIAIYITKNFLWQFLPLYLKKHPVLIQNLITIIIACLYEIHSLIQQGSTPGKRLFHLKVLHNGNYPTIGKAFTRWIMRFISGLLCSIGHIVAFFNREHQTFHDMMCDTLVVEDRYLPSDENYVDNTQCEMPFSREGILRIAKKHKYFCLVYWVLFLTGITIFVLNASEDAGIIDNVNLPVFLKLLSLFGILLSIGLIYFTYGLEKALNKSMLKCIISSILIIMPFIGFLMFLVYSQQAIVILRKAGLPANMEGTSKKDLIAYSVASVTGIHFLTNDFNYNLDYSAVDKHRWQEIIIGILIFIISVSYCSYNLWKQYENDDYQASLHILQTIYDIGSIFSPKSKTIHHDAQSPDGMMRSMEKNREEIARLQDLLDETLPNRKPISDLHTDEHKPIAEESFPFLWCSGEMCKGMTDRVVKDGHFSIKTIWYWQKEPTVTRKPGGIIRYSFMNKEKDDSKQWIAVERSKIPGYLKNKEEILRWANNVGRSMGDFIAPDNQDFTGITQAIWAENPESIKQNYFTTEILNHLGSKLVFEDKEDKAFLVKHGLEMANSLVGTMKIDGVICCYYIVFMMKGRNVKDCEVWKMEVVFPAAYQEVPAENDIKILRPELIKNDFSQNMALYPSNMKIAGMFFGHFKILE